MNLFEDANYLYDAGTKAMNGSKWKYSTQLFEINHLLETAVLQKSSKFAKEENRGISQAVIW